MERGTLDNQYYRFVASTTTTMQLVLMSLPPGDDIKLEVHPSTTQFFRIERGEARIMIGNNIYNVKDGYAVIVPPNTPHYVVNSGEVDLKLYTIYSPPEHPPGRVDIVNPDRRQ